MSKKILIDRDKHEQIYIFEGHMNEFSLCESSLSIHMSSGVEYFDTLVPNIRLPKYDEQSRIKFIDVSYLKFELYGPFEFLIERGKLKENDNLLDYGGGWGNSSMKGKKIPTGFSIEIVCQDIEIEF